MRHGRVTPFRGGVRAGLCPRFCYPSAPCLHLVEVRKRENLLGVLARRPGQAPRFTAASLIRPDPRQPGLGGGFHFSSPQPNLTS